MRSYVAGRPAFGVPWRIDAVVAPMSEPSVHSWWSIVEAQQPALA